LIALWYGTTQHFGQLGQCQRWINILGTIADPERLAQATFAVNDGAERALTLGSDLHRLARPGDFNAEVAWNEVTPGDNSLILRATTLHNERFRTEVRLVVHEGNGWPLPWTVDFAAVQHLPDVVQIVDGLWHSRPDGVYTAEPYYDRVLCMGDNSWTNYEATLRLTVHSFTPSAPGPPTYDVTHFGVAMRWRGHHADGLQPSRKWFPLGAQGEFLLAADPGACQWRILFDGTRDKRPQYASGRNTLTQGQRMLVRTQVCTLPDGRSRYRFKQWQDNQAEPETWDVEGYEVDDVPSGSLCLVAHNSTVTIHDVCVVPLDGPPFA
jgi:hypothetical protein